MASDLSCLTDRYAKALSDLEIDLIGNTKFSRIAIGGPACRAVWEWQVTNDTQVWNLHIIITARFPDEPPVVRVAGWDKDRSDRPHIDRDGVVCTIPAATAIDSLDACALFHHVVSATESIIRGTSTEDFRDEFEHYWEKRASPNVPELVVVDAIPDGVETCYCRAAQQMLCVGSTSDSVAHWMGAVFGRSGCGFRHLEGVVLRLPQSLLPANFPNTCEDVLSLAEVHDQAAYARMKRIILHTHAEFVVLILQGVSPQHSFAAVTLKGLGLAHAKRSTSGSANAHRPFTTTERDRTKRALCNRNRVRRADSLRIQHRGGDGRNLIGKSALVIGCGSLGGYVAHLLSRAGVGRLTLTDNDTFQYENLGRHILGARSRGVPKALALAGRLQGEMPHLHVRGLLGDWRDLLPNHPALLDNDIVVSTVADWRCERPLNELMRTRHPDRPLVMGWLEPYAVAGHCLVMAGPGCYECAANSYGGFTKAVAAFPGTTLQREPGGCTHYQQYGPTALMPVASLIASSVVDVLTQPPSTSRLHTWVSSEDHFQSVHATVTPAWQERLSHEGYQRTFHTEWARVEHCRVCAK